MSPANKDEQTDEQDKLSRVLVEVPKGAFALGFLMIALLLIGWFFVYFAIFIPRGSVG